MELYYSKVKRYNSSPNIKNTPTRRQTQLTLDRFIASRKSLNIESAHHKLISDVDDDVFYEGSSKCRKSPSYLKRLSSLRGSSEDDRILNFSPVSKKRAIKSSQDLSLKSSKEARQYLLPISPEKILDLPDVCEQTLAHAVDWGPTGHLAAALGNAVYICEPGVAPKSIVYEAEGTYKSVAWNSDGTLLACSTSKGGIQVWSVESGKMIFKARLQHSSKNEECAVNVLAWNPRTGILTTGCERGRIEHWDVSTGEIVSNIRAAHSGYEVCALQFSPNGMYLASGGGDRALKVWQDSSQDCLFKKVFYSPVQALAWYPWRSNILAVADQNTGNIQIWNIFSEEKLAELNTKTEVFGLIWCKVTKELISSQTTRTDCHEVAFWNYPNLQHVGNIYGHYGKILHMTFSPCGTKLATASADETLRIWKVAEKTSDVRPPSHSSPLLQTIR